MKIAHLQKTSLIDYPGRISSVIFTQGCNAHCIYCHNPELIPAVSSEKINTDTNYVLYQLKKRRNLVDSLVITGGEPLLQTDLFDFITVVKQIGLRVKLDTNGFSFNLLEKILKENLVDYVALDYKAPKYLFEKITGVSITKYQSFKDSLNLLKTFNVNYELRSTISPRLFAMDDLKAMAEEIEGVQKYYIQNMHNQGKMYDQKLCKHLEYGKRELLEIKNMFSNYVNEVYIRG